MPDFPLVSVLFVTYKRFEHLQRSVTAFRKNTSYENLEIIIADDGSGREIQAQIAGLGADHNAFGPRNRGLGANNNAGLKLAKGKYILMIQDDWICLGPSDYLHNAITMLEANPKVGLLNFAGAPHSPDENCPLYGSPEPCYETPSAFEDGRIEYFLYSDQPHIQTRDALNHVGLYVESRDMEICENDYNIRWRDQTKFATAVFPAYYMRTFRNDGVEVSFRTTRFRYTVAASLQWLKPALLRLSPRVFRFCRDSVQRCITMLERLHVVR